MESIELIRGNLRRSRDLVLARIEELEPYAWTPPTTAGGGSALWILGHLATLEAMVRVRFLEDRASPRAPWEPVFDGDAPPGDPARCPSFGDVLDACRAERAATIALVDGLAEADLDRAARGAPAAEPELFGTWRSCLQYLADHWLMHRGQLADCRRAAGLQRAWY